MRRCYRTVVPAGAFDQLREQAPDFTASMDTLAAKPYRWTHDELGAIIDIRAVADRKWHAMQAHRSQQPNLDRLARLRDVIGFVAQSETYIRAFPDPGGPPVDADLFAGVVARSRPPPAG